MTASGLGKGVEVVLQELSVIGCFTFRVTWLAYLKSTPAGSRDARD